MEIAFVFGAFGILVMASIENWSHIAKARKEIEDLQKGSVQDSRRIDALEEKCKSFDSLAKELGYEYVSEAVKKELRRWSGDRREPEAVLRYSWKKIEPKRIIKQ